MRLTTEAKYSPAQLAKEVARSMVQDLEHVLRLADAGKPISGAVQDMADALTARIMRYRSQIITSPYDNVSDEEWAEAHCEAAQTIYEAEDVERQPTHEEIDAALESMRERRGSACA